MTDERCTKFIAGVRELWPRYKTTDAELFELWRAKYLSRWSDNELAWALRSVKHMDWDATRPKWSAVFDRLRAKRVEEKDEWQELLDSWRRYLKAAGDKRAYEHDDEYIWISYATGVAQLSLREYHELIAMSLDELAKRGMDKYDRLFRIGRLASEYRHWVEWFDEHERERPAWLVQLPEPDLPGTKKVMDGYVVELADDGTTWVRIRPFGPRPEVEIGAAIASAPDDAPATDTESAKTEDRPEEVSDSDLRRKAGNGPRIDAMELG